MKKRFFKLKKYQNPYLPKRKAPASMKVRKGKRMIILFILAVIVVGFLYIIIYSPLFKIKKIVVSGDGKDKLLNEIRIIAKRETSGYDLYIWPRDNIILLNKEMLAAVINNQVALDELKIEKKFLHTLSIEADEKAPQLLWREGDEYYYIDKLGIVMGAVPFENIEYDLPLISRGTTTQVIVGRKIIEPKNLEFIQEVLAKISKKMYKWQVNQIVAPLVDNSEIYFYTNEGWYFIIKADGNIERSIDNLEQLLKQKIKKRSGLEYVDLRIEDRIYYKISN